MIYVDETEPDEDLEAPFPPRNVEVKVDVDMRKYYDLQNEIGRGRFGTVYLCNDKDTRQKFAAKFVNTKRNQDRENVEREIEIMKVLNKDKPHPLMIQLFDAFDVGKEMCLILEVVDGGELFERVIDDDFVLTERACAIFVKQICQALEFIHSKNVLHLDMKPENILCLSREGNRVKICDFGLARKFDPKKKLQVLFGTPEFVAPEVVNFEPISFGTDMWSVGVITYVLLSGLSPFMGHDYVETMTNVTKNKYDFDDEAFDTVSEEAKEFIRLLLVLDKRMRMIPEKCVVHPWIKDNLKLGISSRKLDKRRLSNYVVKHRWNKALHSVQAVVRMGMAGLKAKPLVRTKTSKDLFSNIQEINTESDLKQSMSMTGINSLDHAKTTNEVVDFRNNVNNEDVSTLRFNSKQFNHKGNTNYTKDGNYDTKRYSSPATEDFSNSDNELEDEFSSSQNLNMLSTRDRSSIIFKLLAGYASKEQPVYSKNWNLERTIKQRATLSSPIETPKFLIKDGRPINSGAVLRIANLFSSNKFS